MSTAAGEIPATVGGEHRRGQQDPPTTLTTTNSITSTNGDDRTTSTMDHGNVTMISEEEEGPNVAARGMNVMTATESTTATTDDGNVVVTNALPNPIITTPAVPFVLPSGDEITSKNTLQSHSLLAAAVAAAEEAQTATVVGALPKEAVPHPLDTHPLVHTTNTTTKRRFSHDLFADARLVEAHSNTHNSNSHMGGFGAFLEVRHRSTRANEVLMEMGGEGVVVRDIEDINNNDDDNGDSSRYHPMSHPSDQVGMIQREKNATTTGAEQPMYFSFTRRGMMVVISIVVLLVIMSAAIGTVLGIVCGQGYCSSSTSSSTNDSILPPTLATAPSPSSTVGNSTTNNNDNDNDTITTKTVSSPTSAPKTSTTTTGVPMTLIATDRPNQTSHQPSASTLTPTMEYSSSGDGGKLPTHSNSTHTTTAGTKPPFNVSITNPNGYHSHIIAADFIATNGVVHKIDTVLIPEFWVTDIAGLALTPIGSACSLWFAIVDALQIMSIFKGDDVGFFTLFVPTDAAWLALGNDTLDALLLPENQMNLTNIIVHHIVVGVQPSSMLVTGSSIMALQGYDLYIGGSTVAITVNDSTIVAPDVLANNGIVHVIDRVLMEPFIVVDDFNITTNTTTQPPGAMDRSIVAMFHGGTETTTNITVDDVIFGDSDLSTLASAMYVAELVGVICLNCNYTLFAPTNDAFAVLDADYWTMLLTPPWIMHLTNLLAFHITNHTADRILFSDLSDGMSLPMLNGESITLEFGVETHHVG